MLVKTRDSGVWTKGALVKHEKHVYHSVPKSCQEKSPAQCTGAARV